MLLINLQNFYIKIYVFLSCQLDFFNGEINQYICAKLFLFYS